MRSNNRRTRNDRTKKSDTMNVFTTQEHSFSLQYGSVIKNDDELQDAVNPDHFEVKILSQENFVEPSSNLFVEDTPSPQANAPIPEIALDDDTIVTPTPMTNIPRETS